MHSPTRDEVPAEMLLVHDIPHLPEAVVHTVVDGLLGDVRDLEAEVRQLQQALATRAPIEQAKGVVMLRYGLDADAAFQVLVRWSSVSNVKLRDLAQTVVEIVSQGHDPSDCHPAVLERVGELADITETHHGQGPQRRRGEPTTIRGHDLPRAPEVEPVATPRPGVRAAG